jgi:hypothetical protein
MEKDTNAAALAAVADAVDKWPEVPRVVRAHLIFWRMLRAAAFACFIAVPPGVAAMEVVYVYGMRIPMGDPNTDVLLSEMRTVAAQAMMFEMSITMPEYFTAEQRSAPLCRDIMGRVRAQCVRDATSVYAEKVKICHDRAGNGAFPAVTIDGRVIQVSWDPIRPVSACVDIMEAERIDAVAHCDVNYFRAVIEVCDSSGSSSTQ